MLTTLIAATAIAQGKLDADPEALRHVSRCLVRSGMAADFAKLVNALGADQPDEKAIAAIRRRIRKAVGPSEDLPQPSLFWDRVKVGDVGVPVKPGKASATLEAIMDDDTAIVAYEDRFFFFRRMKSYAPPGKPVAIKGCWKATKQAEHRMADGHYERVTVMEQYDDAPAVALWRRAMGFDAPKG